MIPNISRWLAAHKVLAAVIVICIAGGGYAVFRHFQSSAQPTKYVIGTAAKGTIITTVTGSGQVSAKNEMELQTKTSGTLVALNAAVGAQVKAGTLIGQVDAQDAALALQNAELSYQNLTTVDPAKLRTDQQAVANAETAQRNGLIAARATLSSAVVDMNDTWTGLTDQFVGGYIDPTNKFDRSETAKSYVDKAQQSYYATKSQEQDLEKAYASLSSDTSTSTFMNVSKEAYAVSQSLAETAKYTKDAAAYLQDHTETNTAAADAAYTAITDLLTKANTTVSDLLSAQNTMAENTQSLQNAQYDLETLLAGPSAVDLSSNSLSLREKQQAYADNFIRAPFDGVIASVPVAKGDTVGNGTTIATLITQEKIAEISLNEIDAAKVQAGEKVTLTFDAIDGLTIAGEVTSVDLIGTVSQGVVSYKVEIGFDSNDDRVKPGMTVNASIITNIHQDVITVPSTAVTAAGGTSYVSVVDPAVPQSEVGQSGGVELPNAPKRVAVETGLSDDTSTEITAGLTEGQQYVERTITSGAAATTRSSTQAPSLFGGGNRAAAGGGAARNVRFGG